MLAAVSFIYIYIYILSFFFFFLNFRCMGFKVQNGQAPCRKPHLRSTESCGPSQKKKQTAAKSAVKDNFISIYCYSHNKIFIKKSII